MEKVMEGDSFTRKSFSDMDDRLRGEVLSIVLPYIRRSVYLRKKKGQSPKGNKVLRLGNLFPNMDKAGAYAIQGLASVFVKKIEGCYFNVMGFPLYLFCNMLNGMGVDLFWKP